VPYRKKTADELSVDRQIHAEEGSLQPHGHRQCPILCSAEVARALASAIRPAQPHYLYSRFACCNLSGLNLTIAPSKTLGLDGQNGQEVSGDSESGQFWTQ
jgi:hypothetical protein